MNIRASIACAALAAAVVPCARAGAESAIRGTAVTAELRAGHVVCPSKKVVGLPIRNDSEKFVGDVGDLLIDPANGEIRYAVVEVGGFLGMGEDQRIVPWAYVEVDPDENEPDKVRALTSLSEAQVKSAPRSKRGQRYDGELDRRIEATFGKDDAWTYGGEGQASFVWLSQLDGILLQSDDGRRIGQIADVVLAPQNGCVAYVAISLGAKAGGKQVAIPWSNIRFAYDRNDQLQATTSLAPSRLADAPEYDAKDAKRMSSVRWIDEVAAYYGSEPFWKATRFASARKIPQR